MKVEYDFRQVKRASEVQHLNQLREDNSKELLIESSVDELIKAKTNDLDNDLDEECDN